MNNMKFKIGDKVIINDISSEKYGLKGKIKTLLVNGAIIEITKDHFIPVKFNHLAKEEICKHCKEKYEKNHLNQIMCYQCQISPHRRRKNNEDRWCECGGVKMEESEFCKDCI